ncbi:DUF5615 family PIN-like protein [Aerosakkonema sp. BLCC-F183]|uniref:DUF5615 family PIN-like protein n=1 Tax=Aerosakkonema sp. BLCC-F183 TaxID=3342834 RepID=UPI0035B977C2
MKFLIDQDVYAVTAKFLMDTGHDVILVSQINLAQASDEEILTADQEQNRILVTRDRDYGNLVFVRAIGTGVIYLRVLPKTFYQNPRPIALSVGSCRNFSPKNCQNVGKMSERSDKIGKS